MGLDAGRPRCTAPVARTPSGWSCVEHGATRPVWRPGTCDYETFGEHLARRGDFPTYLPWPLGRAVSTEWDRSVVAGEAFGRWLWLVLRPASPMLPLRDDWILRDTARCGPHLVELPFGGPAPAW